MRKLKLIVALAVFIPLILSLPVLAEIVPVDAGLSEVQENELAFILKDIFKKVGSFIGLAAVGSLIFNAYRMTIGNEKQREAAKTYVIWSLVAVITVSLAFIIVGWVAGLPT